MLTGSHCDIYQAVTSNPIKTRRTIPAMKVRSLDEYSTIRETGFLPASMNDLAMTGTTKG